jgi:acetyl esterase/lipase
MTAIRPRLSRGVVLFCLLIIGSRIAAADGAGVTVTADVAYKTGPALSEYEQTRCKLDLYAPTGAKDLPCVVWFHGGGLTGGNNKGAKAGGHALAAEGIILAAVNYRLSPQVKYPAYVEDAAAAVAWMKQHAGEYGADPKRIYVAGHSAGGYLAAMVGADARWLKPYGVTLSDLAGVIPLSGQMATHYTIREERGLEKTAIIIDDAAPLNHAGKDTPPWLVLYAEKDMTLRGDENRYFAAALLAAGHKQVEIREMKGYDHGGIGGRIGETDDAVRKAMVEFIRKTAPPKP